MRPQRLGLGLATARTLLNQKEIIYIEHYLYFREIMTFSFHKNIFKVDTLSKITTEN